VKATIKARTLETERAERLARIDLSTLSTLELELIEVYRALRADKRAAIVTIMRMQVDGSVHLKPAKGGA
jgi:hypothetical protein